MDGRLSPCRELVISVLLGLIGDLSVQIIQAPIRELGLTIGFFFVSSSHAFPHVRLLYPAVMGEIYTSFSSPLSLIGDSMGSLSLSWRMLSTRVRYSL